MPARRYKRTGRLPARMKEPLVIPQDINHTWSMDFMCDTLVSGRRFRVLNIMDDYIRELLANEVDTSLPALRVLERLVAYRGKPKAIRVDNGPEFISERLKTQCTFYSLSLLLGDTKTGGAYTSLSFYSLSTHLHVFYHFLKK